jgi:taurine dioxygenase
LAFSRRFGEIETHAYAKGLPGHPEILPVIKEVKDRAANFGGIWHSDVSFDEKPPMGQILYVLEVPGSGGDTIFVNMYRAYDALSDGMKALLNGLKAVHTCECSYGANNSQVTLRQEQFSQSMDVQTQRRRSRIQWLVPIRRTVANHCSSALSQCRNSKT